MNDLSLFLPCAAGVEDFLAQEVHAITGRAGADLQVLRAGVRVHAAWRDVLTGHLHALTKLTDEVGRLREENSERLRAAMRATQETLAGLGESTGEYTTQGDRARGDSARIIDTEM